MSGEENVQVVEPEEEVAGSDAVIDFWPSDEPADKPAGKAEGQEPSGKAKDDERKAWDKDRQNRDQERAEHLKRQDGQVDQLTGMVNALVEQNKLLLSRRDGGNDAARARVDAIQDELEQLTEEADGGQVVGGIKALAGRIRALSEKFEAETATLKADKAELEDRLTRREEQDRDREGKDELNTLMSKLSGEYGAHHREEARRLAAKDLRDEGYDPQKNPIPDTAEGRGLVRRALRDAFKACAEKEAAEKGHRARSPRLDTSGGGVTASWEGGKQGGNRAVAAAMRQEGKL